MKESGFQVAALGLTGAFYSDANLFGRRFSLPTPILTHCFPSFALQFWCVSFANF